MIATLTLNPALDKSTEVERLVPEKKMRCAEPFITPGGGGINVSKAIKELGGESLAVFPCGGLNGSMLQNQLRELSINVDAIPVAGDTRENFAVNELSSGKQYRFIMPGAPLNAKDLANIREHLWKAEGLRYLVCSGSLPPGVPDDFIAEIAAIATKKRFRLVVDTSGRSLQKALETGVYLVKPNMTELCSLAGKDYLEGPEIKNAAMAIVSKHQTEIVVVSMGPAGAMLVTKGECKSFPAPVVKKLNTVGAGDSMVAGIVWMLATGKPLIEAVRFGIACGTAATVSKSSKLFNKADAERFYGER